MLNKKYSENIFLTRNNYLNTVVNNFSSTILIPLRIIYGNNKSMTNLR